jgi:prepilin-type N-terminal cleavage/methylation domain-containing protein
MQRIAQESVTMTTHISKRKQSGFTLVELLIVAIILAILAAIVVPQFANVAAGSSEAALRTNLSGIRSAVELYRQQHAQVYPGANASNAVLCGTGPGAGAVATGQAFDDQLTMYTNTVGVACSVQNDGGTLYPFGPYIKENAVPANPVTTVATIVVNADANLGLQSATAGGGWLFSTSTGKFLADDTNTDAAGARYDSY